MPLVPQTKMADVSKLISLGNLLARKTTWLVLTTTSATSILSRVFGAYCMTRIVYEYSRLPTLILFHIFTYRVNTLFPLWLPERILSLSISTNRVNTLFLFLHLTFSSQPPRKCILHATILFLVILFRGDFFHIFSVSLEHRNFVKPQKETNSRNTHRSLLLNCPFL